MGKIPDSKLLEIKKLYSEKGLTMQQISSRLEVSIDAVCYFMRHHGIRRRTLSEVNKLRFVNKPLSFRVNKSKFFRNQLLKIIGVTLYWCEGYKTQKSHGIDFANSDPSMISVFVKFLRNICGVDNRRLRVLLYCYSNQDPEKLINFWSKKTKIPKNQFSKPYVRRDYQIAKSDKMTYGLVHIRYMDKKLLAVMRDWIKELNKQNA